MTATVSKEPSPAGSSAANSLCRERALVLAAELLRSIEPADRRLSAVVRDVSAAAFTFTLTDEVLRCRDPKTAARIFRALIGRGVPQSFPLLDRLLLFAGAQAASVAPSLVMKLVAGRLRHVSANSVLPSSDPALKKRLAQTHSEGSRTNVNVLGEAIIGEREAVSRRDRVVAMLGRADVDAVSVKLSSIAANISPLAFDQTVDRLRVRFEPICHAAMSRTNPALVTLDMEEFRDLELTAAVLLGVLSNPRFDQLRAGVVLQAYLPDAHAIAEQLVDCARSRVARGGAPLRIRLVKGANLAMERVDAELHRWPLAPYGSKAETDASFKRLLRFLLEPANQGAVIIGLASHNVFDIAYGIALVENERAQHRLPHVEFETLEGMATGLGHALSLRGELSLVYSPVVDHGAFEAAIAYLVRRLDENTHPENFLHAVVDLKAGSARFELEAAKFADSLHQSYSLPTLSHRSPITGHRTDAALLVGDFQNEPDSDFSVSTQRNAAAYAVQTWKGFEQSVRPVVGGTARSTAKKHSLRNPSTGKDFGVVYLADPQLVDECVAIARHAVSAWAERSLSERAAMLSGIANQIASRRYEITACMAYETGKTIAQGDPEVSEAIDFARYYASQNVLLEDLARSGLQSSPYGVVVVTPPWNFPFAILLGGVTSALMAGNAVIIKPAPQAVLCARMVAECCWDAGVSKDLVQFLPCEDDEVGQHLVSHHGVNLVLLTGAVETARMFQQWRPQTTVMAETSGKNAMVITASADIDLALKDLVFSAFGHAGQKCSAASLAILAPCWYDDPFVMDRLADAVRSLRVGNALDMAVDVGPLIEAPSTKLQRALTILEPGESWLVEPMPLDAAGQLWSPGVRVGVTNGSWFHQTECFGPVLGIMRAETLNEAIVMQNGVDFGLTAGLHSLDETEIATWVERIEAGNLYVNRSITGAIVQRQPFGGWKASSFGPGAKAGGPNSVLALQRWNQNEEPQPEQLLTLDRVFAESARSFFFAKLDLSRLKAESNMFHHRPLPLGVAVRVGPEAPSWFRQVMEAASQASATPCWFSDAAIETDDAFLRRLTSIRADRVRLLGSGSLKLRGALHNMGMVVDDAPPTINPRVELRHWLREQSITISRHRHGHMIIG